MKRIYRIYVLRHPVSKEVRYVGATVGQLNVRLSQHKHASFTKKVDTHVAKWFRSLKKDNLLPIIELVETCTKSNWEDREKYWIKQHQNLTNIRDGGQGIVVDRSIEGKQRSINSHKKPVVLLDKDYKLIQRFDSGKDCALYLKVPETSISNMIVGRSKTVRGYVVMIESIYESGNFEAKYEGSHRNIFQYSPTGKLVAKYPSFAEALNTIKPCKYSSGLHEAVKRRSKCGKFYWSTEEIVNFEEYINNKI